MADLEDRGYVCNLLHKALSTQADFVEDWISHRLVLC
jgi:hypothetical protein